MGKEKNSKEGNPPKIKDKSIVQKKKKLKTTATLLNNNGSNSDGLRSLISSERPSPSKQQKCVTSSQHKSRSPKFHHNSEPQKTPENLNEKPSTSSTGEDVMDWEPITEKEVIDTLHEIRRDFTTRTTFHPIASPSEKFSSITSASAALHHVVIDTNIFLLHLPIVQMLVEKEEFCSKVQILVPWMVLQELDFMKTNRENKVKLEIMARKAGTFIFEQISKKNAFFRTQTLEEFKSCINLLPDENADDKILQWCLYLKKEIGSDITLLSNDILFCAKASANGIQPFQSDNFIQQLPLHIVQKPPCVSPLIPNNCVSVTDLKPIPEVSSSQTPSTPNHQAYQECFKEKELICATTFLQQFEKSIVDSFSQVKKNILACFFMIMRHHLNILYFIDN
jgi:rRNA-processing protein FCF1